MDFPNFAAGKRNDSMRNEVTWSSIQQNKSSNNLRGKAVFSGQEKTPYL